MAKIPKAQINHCRTGRITPAGPPCHRRGAPRPIPDAYRMRGRFASTARGHTKRRQSVRSRATRSTSRARCSARFRCTGNRERATGRAMSQAERRATSQQTRNSLEVQRVNAEARRPAPRAVEGVPRSGDASRAAGAAPQCVVRHLSTKLAARPRGAATDALLHQGNSHRVTTRHLRAAASRARKTGCARSGKSRQDQANQRWVGVV